MPANQTRRETQMVRILGILNTLLQGGRPSVYQLADQFETRRETIYRDLKALTRAGFPIVGDENGYLSHPRLLDTANRGVPAIPLNDEEIAALIWASGTHSPEAPFGKALDSASQKLRAMAITRRQPLAADLEQTILASPRGSKDYSGHHSIILNLAEAIIRQRACTVTYQSPGGETKTYPYHPYRFLPVHGGLYCIGRVPAYENWVTLAVERIQRLQLRQEGFAIDGKLDPDRYVTEAFGVVWEEPMTIVLRFSPDQAPYVAEREWHPTQSLKTLPDGCVELTFRAGGCHEIVRWILGWGETVEVIKPSGLRRELAKRLESAAGKYARKL